MGDVALEMNAAFGWLITSCERWPIGRQQPLKSAAQYFELFLANQRRDIRFHQILAFGGGGSRSLACCGYNGHLVAAAARGGLQFNHLPMHQAADRGMRRLPRYMQCPGQL